MTNWTEWLGDSARAITGCDFQGTKVAEAAQILITAATSDNPILICGNGGSAADAMHFSAELVGRYKKNRRAIRAMALGADPAILTAWANDHDFSEIFTRQIEAHAKKDGVLVAISTSGRSENVRNSIVAASACGMKTIGLTGAAGFPDIEPHVEIRVPSKFTPLIQQAHICIIHYLCQRIEDAIA